MALRSPSLMGLAAVPSAMYVVGHYLAIC